MSKYEVMYIINVAVEDEPRAELIARFSDLVAKNGGVVEKIDEMGKRRLAYPIDDMNEGFYVLMHFEAGPELPRELERNLQISEDVLRYLVTRKPEV